MRRLNLLAAATLACLLTGANAAESTVAFDGCEYRVTLPGEPTIKAGRTISQGAAAGRSKVAEIRGSLPSFRVECGAIGRLPPGADRYAAEDALRLMESMQLTSTEHSVERTRLGTLVKFSGTSLQARGIPFVVSGMIILGQRSMLNVIATEAASTYPSEAVTRVFNSIER